ncbi:MAG: VCBS repeat-containing protein [Candidatus Zixiibacteriota bacterium]|nr:MAG: VCBS repeat-containing protein [candidate division Zixibacteria bacterium]
MLLSRKFSNQSYRHLNWAVAIILVFLLANCSDKKHESTVAPMTDLGPTAVVSDLRVAAVKADRITISWTAPATNGKELGYQIRYSEDSLTDANWFDGTVCLYVPPMEDSGVTQSYDVTGLPAGKLSYIAIRIQNSRGVLGPVSKNVSGTVPSLLTKPASYSIAGSDITASDLDSDGDMDIVIINGGLPRENLHTLLNDGSGTFVESQTFSITGELEVVRTADFNNDGFNDIATLSTSSFLVLTNDGTGLFAVTDSQYIGHMGYVMQAGDFNGDGFADITVGTYFYGGKFGPSTGRLIIYFNDEAGGFEDTVTVNTIVGVDGICVFDADDDGDLDIAGTYEDVSSITLQYNDGTGRNWDHRQSVGPGHHTSCVTPGDLNSDGKLDLIGNITYEGKILTAIRTDAGGYRPNISTPGAGGGGDIQLGDFDGDGYLDAARGTSVLTLHLNDGEGGFSGAARYETGTDERMKALTVADFDGDGHSDVAMLETSGKLMIFLSLL